ncbi:EVE domain-containing protein [Methylocapsa sp. S129]|uniref:EVE domain-containing protein n=1 Tax=Methylocapsa sp. S129 TaxID=1641869 RepID=UPI00131C9B07|nr:EVE domain-containing protein [Methylocapsa sp. S129]
MRAVTLKKPTLSCPCEGVDAPPPRRNWVAVACADHVDRGRKLGMMQVCHGKAGPLGRVRAGDRVAYYSPTIVFGGREKRQAFTAIGTVRGEQAYQVDMGGGFRPFRRDVEWRQSVEAPIHALRMRLELTRDKQNWGYAFRFGLLNISEHDMDLIVKAMTSPFAVASISNSL